MAKNRNVMVGTVVLIAFGILFLAVFAIGQDQALFSLQERFYLLLPNAQGLQIGSPVKLVGVQVGAVSAIRLPDGEEEPNIQITLKIKRSHAGRVRVDTEAKLRFLNPLGGERFIELTLGSADQPSLPPGSEIMAPLSELDILLTQGTDIASNVAEVTNTLRVVFDRIERQEGILGQLLLSPTFAADTLLDLGSTAASLRRVTAQLETGNGLLGALIYDGELRERTTQDLTSVISRFDRLLTQLEDPTSPLGSLLQGNAATGEILDNLQHASRSFRDIAERLDDDQGLLVRLLSDAEYADQVLADLEDTARNMASITGKVDRGEGSLGALVNDPLLYQGMRDVVTGVQDSRFLRWMAQRYARKGGARRAGVSD
ncbi:MAG: MCE family protein [Acidobacteria bacterium]|nr:MAG: MCE family protein [Acidobacteriota bacterium]